VFRDHARGIAAFFRLLRKGRLKHLARIVDQGRTVGLFQVTKFESAESVRRGEPYSVGAPFHNIFVNTGLMEVWRLVTSQGGVGFSNANANLGVGDSAVPTTVTMTDLQAAVNKFRKAMNAGYPNAPVNGLEQWQSDFTGAEANFAWEEFGVFNAPAAGVMMDRAVDPQGIKTPGQLWRLTFSFTLT
jgi:hypothetical protein